MNQIITNNEVEHAEEMRDRAEANLETIDCQKGRIRFNKGFFKATGAIGVLSAGIGVVEVISSIPVDPAIVPAVTIALGAVTTGVSAYFHHQETLEDEDLTIAERNNVEAQALAETIIATNNQNKTKTR